MDHVHQPAAGYQVTLNGRLLGATPTQVFALHGLDPNTNYTAEVRTVWQDGTLSEKKAELKFTLKQILPTRCFLSELDPVRFDAGLAADRSSIETSTAADFRLAVGSLKKALACRRIRRSSLS